MQRRVAVQWVTIGGFFLAAATIQTLLFAFVFDPGRAFAGDGRRADYMWVDGLTTLVLWILLLRVFYNPVVDYVGGPPIPVDPVPWTAPLATGESVTEPATKTCPMCAEEVKYPAKICRFCRYTFVAEAAEGVEVTPQEPKITPQEPVGRDKSPVEVASGLRSSRYGSWLMENAVGGLPLGTQVTIHRDGSGIAIESSRFVLMLSVASVQPSTRDGRLVIRDPLRELLLRPLEDQDPGRIASELATASDVLPSNLYGHPPDAPGDAPGAPSGSAWI